MEPRGITSIFWLLEDQNIWAYNGILWEKDSIVSIHIYIYIRVRGLFLENDKNSVPKMWFMEKRQIKGLSSSIMVLGGNINMNWWHV